MQKNGGTSYSRTGGRCPLSTNMCAVISVIILYQSTPQHRTNLISIQHIRMFTFSTLLATYFDYSSASSNWQLHCIRLTLCCHSFMQYLIKPTHVQTNFQTPLINYAARMHHLRAVHGSPGEVQRLHTYVRVYHP